MPWYIAPCAYRMKLDPNGPQPGEHARQQDQELEGDFVSAIGQGCQMLTSQDTAKAG